MTTATRIASLETENHVLREQLEHTTALLTYALSGFPGNEGLFPGAVARMERLEDEAREKIKGAGNV